MQRVMTVERSFHYVYNFAVPSIDEISAHFIPNFHQMANYFKLLLVISQNDHVISNFYAFFYDYRTNMNQWRSKYLHLLYYFSYCSHIQCKLQIMCFYCYYYTLPVLFIIDVIIHYNYYCINCHLLYIITVVINIINKINKKLLIVTFSNSMYETRFKNLETINDWNLMIIGWISS